MLNAGVQMKLERTKRHTWFLHIGENRYQMTFSGRRKSHRWTVCGGGAPNFRINLPHSAFTKVGAIIQMWHCAIFELRPDIEALEAVMEHAADLPVRSRGTVATHHKQQAAPPCEN